MRKFIFLLALLSVTALQAETNVLLFAGSLRQESLNKKLIEEAAYIAQELGANVQVIKLNDYPIPFYNEDEEISLGMHENAKKVRDLMLQSQVIMISSPNYNRSYPGVLKNLLDWASRSETASESYEAFQGKTFALLCSGPGASGGVKGIESLRQLLIVLKGNVLPEHFALPYGTIAYDEQGHLKDPEMRENLKAFVKKALE